MREHARGIVRAAVSAALALAFGLAGASDPPDSRVNPQSGLIHVVDSAWNGANYDIRHALNSGGGAPPEVTTLTSDSHDDLGPRIAIDSVGDVWVAWWRDAATDQVVVRRRTYASGAWSAETVVSSPDESSRGPRIAHDGAAAWIVYETVAAAGVAIVVVHSDDPTMWPLRTQLAVTSYEGSLDLRIHAESGRLWVTWIDSNTDIGWRAYDQGAATWSSMNRERFADDSVAAARERVRSVVLAE